MTLKDAINWLETSNDVPEDVDTIIKNEIESLNKEIEKQQEEIKSLTAENDFLKFMYRDTTEYKAIKKKVEELG